MIKEIFRSLNEERISKEEREKREDKLIKYLKKNKTKLKKIADFLQNTVFKKGMKLNFSKFGDEYYNNTNIYSIIYSYFKEDYPDFIEKVEENDLIEALTGLCLLEVYAEKILADFINDKLKNIHTKNKIKPARVSSEIYFYDNFIHYIPGYLAGFNDLKNINIKISILLREVEYAGTPDAVEVDTHLIQSGFIIKNLFTFNLSEKNIKKLLIDNMKIISNKEEMLRNIINSTSKNNNFSDYKTNDKIFLIYKDFKFVSYVSKIKNNEIEIIYNCDEDKFCSKWIPLKKIKNGIIYLEEF